MTSLAGAVQQVEAGDLLEPLAVRGPARAFADLRAVAAQTDSGSPRAAMDVACNESRAYLFAKRAADIIGSLAGLVFFAPIFFVVAVVTKLSDGGPVFYTHTRIGKWGREFRCVKFRTMVVNADHQKEELAHLNTHDDHRTFKVPDDPRVTRFGRLLRRSSMDEAPQLWNVLLGHMSLVGPRPPVPAEVERYDLDDMQRLIVKPGLTCIWQVSGRSRLPFSKQLELDLEYIEQQNFWLDMKLIARTVPAVLSADGAY
jgi:lipopolysaccharide/colanic/teichoic acid biosynthesis glycosyltransferase